MKKFLLCAPPMAYRLYLKAESPNQLYEDSRVIRFSTRCTARCLLRTSGDLSERTRTLPVLVLLLSTETESFDSHFQKCTFALKFFSITLHFVSLALHIISRSRGAVGIAALLCR